MKTIKEWVAAYVLTFGRNQAHESFVDNELKFLNAMERSLDIGCRGKSRTIRQWNSTRQDELDAVQLICAATHPGSCEYKYRAHLAIWRSPLWAQWVREFGTESLHDS